MERRLGTRIEGDTPWERLGGDEGALVILQDFYDRLYADLMIGFFFHPHDKARLVDSQLRFVGRALGSRTPYLGKSIRRAHAPLGILPGQFWRRHTILRETLAAHGVPEDIVELWLTLDRKLMPSVVQSRPGP